MNAAPCLRKGAHHLCTIDNSGSSEAGVIWQRHGTARPGLWEVNFYSYGSTDWRLLMPSMFAAVDDFGQLVKVGVAYD